MIKEVKEASLIAHVFEYDVLLVPMGINNAMNNGFAKEVKINFPDVYKLESERSPYGDKRKYGTTLGIESEGLIFCMCYIYSTSSRGLELNYEALGNSLREASIKYRGKKIASPLMGTSPYDGNGDAEKVLELYKSHFNDTDIDVYVAPQKDVRSTWFKELYEAHKMVEAGKMTREEYFKKRDEVEWAVRNGIYKPKPSDYHYRRRMGYRKYVINFCRKRKK